MGAETVLEYEKYLRLPSIVGQNKKAAFAPIIERVWSKLKGWKEKMMSQARREILIKVVAQAIPTYAMGWADFGRVKRYKKGKYTGWVGLNFVCPSWWEELGFEISILST